jgi:hypothetical protein
MSWKTVCRLDTKKNGHRIIICCRNSFLEFQYLEDLKAGSGGDPAHCTIIYYCQKVETIPEFVSGQTDKQMWYKCTMEYYLPLRSKKF